MALSQAAFRFGINELTEATHGWHAAQNTNITFPVDTTFLLRFLIQASGGVAHSNTDIDFQYNLNGAGWVTITAFSGAIRATTTVAFADRANPTNRLTGGTGTFESSSQTCATQGPCGGNPNDILANGFCEAEIALTMLSASVTAGNTVQFRVLAESAALATYAQTPTLTVGSAAEATSSSAAGKHSARASAVETADRAAIGSGRHVWSALAPSVRRSVSAAQGAARQQVVATTLVLQVSASSAAGGHSWSGLAPSGKRSANVAAGRHHFSAPTGVSRKLAVASALAAVKPIAIATRGLVARTSAAVPAVARASAAAIRGPAARTANAIGSASGRVATGAVAKAIASAAKGSAGAWAVAAAFATQTTASSAVAAGGRQSSVAIGSTGRAELAAGAVRLGAVATRPAVTREFYVATTGNDGNPGTAASPLATVNRAFDLGLLPGDQVIVQPGTYAEAPFLDEGGTAVGYVTLRAAVPGTALFSTASPNYSCIRVRANYLIIDGLDVVGGDGHAIDLDGVHHVIVRNCILHDSGGGGAAANRCEWLIYENNIVFNNCATNGFQTSGLSMYQCRNVSGDTTTPGFRNIVRNNLCYENFEEPVLAFDHTDGNGIIIDDFQHTQGSTGFPNYTYPTLVEGNLCWGNGGKGIQVFVSDFVTVRNNTCWRNNLDLLNPGTWRGELSNAQCSNNTWVNNIGYTDPSINSNNTAIAFTTFGGYVSVGVTWYNNLTFNGTPGQPSLQLDGGNPAPTAGDGNQLGVDPLFVSIATRNFHLQSSSPALNAGTAAFGFFDTDLDGLPRVVGVIDLGCYEWEPAISSSAAGGQRGDASAADTTGRVATAASAARSYAVATDTTGHRSAASAQARVTSSATDTTRRASAATASAHGSIVAQHTFAQQSAASGRARLSAGSGGAAARSTALVQGSAKTSAAQAIFFGARGNLRQSATAVSLTSSRRSSATAAAHAGALAASTAARVTTTAKGSTATSARQLAGSGVSARVRQSAAATSLTSARQSAALAASAARAAAPGQAGRISPALFVIAGTDVTAAAQADREAIADSSARLSGLTISAASTRQSSVSASARLGAVVTIMPPDVIPLHGRRQGSILRGAHGNGSLQGKSARIALRGRA